MAGTDSTIAAGSGNGPAIILVDPQLGENIGMCARAMLNNELTDLRLVRPRDGWPSEKAFSASSGALEKGVVVRVFDTTDAAIADLQGVYATTARPRSMTQVVMTPRAAAGDMRERVARDQKLGILFGAERKGLHNDDVALSDVVIEAPLNPAYSSLNLAQAVLLVGYEWYQAGVVKPPVEQVMGDTRPATREELAGFFGHLERELDDCGFLRPVEKRPTMVRNIRNIFLRANLTEQEVRTLRGVIVGLVKYGGRFRGEGN